MPLASVIAVTLAAPAVKVTVLPAIGTPPGVSSVAFTVVAPCARNAGEVIVSVEGCVDKTVNGPNVVVAVLPALSIAVPVAVYVPAVEYVIGAGQLTGAPSVVQVKVTMTGRLAGAVPAYGTPTAVAVAVIVGGVRSILIGPTPAVALFPAWSVAA